MERTISYFYEFKANAKERWFNRTILEIMNTDFFSPVKNYAKKAIENGVIKVNDKLVSIDYKVKLHDVITHFVHIHEPIAPQIEVIAEEDEYIVVYKPSGIPCHPTSRYRTFTVLSSLNRNLICAHRLDVPTSGVLILYKKEFKENMKNKLKDTKKIYLAKVKGNFTKPITVDKKIKRILGLGSEISENGKESKTIFKPLKYKNGHTLIECELITGRTHQIRIHLKYLGFTIVNDKKYESNLEFKSVFLKCKSDPLNFTKENERFAVQNCVGINQRVLNYKEDYICLHAYKYFFNNKWYTADLPDWAKEF
ncbi:pseudouridylate synthase [Tubulinosema ratisbonensis]|uniref:Pseudouridylate synthase n=1 Tax=Tubulinosema ratisbonensis TaxID=291195 RepID=A0A437ALM6_9MICR|nr:pseudouridylate synthase [Tubulinosema ratisbonensis]